MAKLRIHDGQGNLIVKAYVNIFNNLIVNQAKNDEFVAPQNRHKRPTLLKEAVGGAGKITQEVDDVTEEEITDTNCMIITERDERRGSGPRSMITIPFPDYTAPPAADVKYLDQYAQIIHDHYDDSNKTKEQAEEDKKTARQFMFAVMMMTRCR